MIVESQPTFGSGLARSAAESAYPHLWRGLVGAWLPALGIQGAKLVDLTGRGNATVGNGTWSTHANGRALYFNASNTNVAFGRPVLTGDFTILIRGKHTALYNSRTLFSQWSSGQAGRLYFIIGASSQRARLYCDDALVGDGPDVTLGAVQAWSVTRAGSTVRYYLDGASVGTSGNFAGAILQADANVGTRDGGTTEPFGGTIDCILVYDRAQPPSLMRHLGRDPLAPFCLHRRACRTDGMPAGRRSVFQSPVLDSLIFCE